MTIRAPLLQATAIIPARKGSKGLPNKNKKLFKGKPLIAHTIEAAKEAQHVARIIVSTDDIELADLAADYGAEVPFLRPARLANDTAPMNKVVRHVLRYLNSIKQLPEHYMLLQPTCPLRDSVHIDDAANLFLSKRYASLMSVCEVQEHPYIMKKIANDELTDFIEQSNQSSRRQDYPPFYRLNGAIYIGRSRLFLQANHFHLKPCCPYVMRQETSIDIDTLADFKAAELAYKRERRP